MNPFMNTWTIVRRKKWSLGGDGDDDYVPSSSPEPPPESYVGNRISKCFRKKLYFGTVINFFPAVENEDDVDLWSIQYDDGCREDFEKTELLRHLVQYENYKYADSKMAIETSSQTTALHVDDSARAFHDKPDSASPAATAATVNSQRQIEGTTSSGKMTQKVTMSEQVRGNDQMETEAHNLFQQQQWIAERSKERQLENQESEESKRLFLGHRVAKYFPDGDLYLGTVQAFSPAIMNVDQTDLWLILYDDKDEEHMTRTELQQALELYASKTKRRFRSKSTSSAS